jgi:type IV secretory pathway TraG/TraD family ATPase VirD4
MKNMVIQDLRYGHGVAVIDPHGELVEDILNFVPRSRTNEVVYFNPADTENPIGLNILEARDENEKQLVASSLISVFKHLWKGFWGPRLEHVFHNAILALMDSSGSTLLGIYRMLADDAYRRGVVSRVKDPVVRLFWQEDFEKYPPNFKKEVASPIQNKIGQLLTSTPLRNIVGQSRSTIDLRFIMDNQRIFLVNLAKGRIGEDKANLLGSVLVTKLYLAALERQDTPEEQRKDFYLYIDEFQNFSTDVFPSILSEARKYRLNLILAHQYLYQLSESVKHSVFGNVGTLASFRVGSIDARELAEEFSPTFSKEDLEHTENYHAYLKLMIDGKRSTPFSAETLPPLTPQGDEAMKDTIIRVSRERFASKREDMTAKIEKWFSK